jgi:uncharacterized phiE125 gp8 family phage protein
MALKLVTAPAVEPISLAEAKAHLRVDHADDDATIDFLIAVARSHLDAVSGWMGRALINQTWDMVVDAFPTVAASCWCGTATPTTGVAAIRLPWPPLQSVTSVKYYDSAGVQQTMPATDYAVDTYSEPGWIIPATGWPTTQATANAVTIRFVAGYGANALTVPAPIRHAVLLLVGHYYENREQVLINPVGAATALELPLGVTHLLNPYREYAL